MPGTTVSHETKLLAAQIQLKQPEAIAKVVEALKANGGNVSATVEALGIKRATLYAWMRDIPQLAKATKKHLRGRIGRPPAEKEPAASAGPKRKRAATK